VRSRPSVLGKKMQKFRNGTAADTFPIAQSEILTDCEKEERQAMYV
jgi:hypothetical protein